MSHPAYIAIRFESLLADRFYYFEMPSVGQYCKQNECDLVYSLYNKKTAHYFNVTGSSVSLILFTNSGLFLSHDGFQSWQESSWPQWKMCNLLLEECHHINGWIKEKHQQKLCQLKILFTMLKNVPEYQCCNEASKIFVLQRFLAEDPSSSSSSVHFKLSKNLRSFEDFRPKIPKIFGIKSLFVEEILKEN